MFFLPLLVAVVDFTLCMDMVEVMLVRTVVFGAIHQTLRICIQVQFSQPTPELGPLQAEF